MRAGGDAVNCRYFIAAALVSGSLMTAGCDAAMHSKAGGAGPPLVLSLADNDGGLSGAPAVARFVAQVSSLSHGRLTVRVEPSWKGGRSETRVIRDVAAGKADLGWSGIRAFDTVGVNAFQPILAPFLVNSYAAESAVVRNPAIRNLLTSVRPLGLSGLALLSDELRMPTATARPLLTPAEFKDLPFGTFASKIQADGIQALGAEPRIVATPRPPDTDGLGGIETMWWTYATNAQYASMRFVTANAALWPRTIAIFANSKHLAALGPQAKDWLTQAADDASNWSAAHAGDGVAQQIAQVCQFGSRIATATAGQLVALRAAAEPVYAALRADPELNRTLTRIEELVRNVGPAEPSPVPADCAYRAGDEDLVSASGARTSPGRAGKLPEGVYRFVMTYSELRAHGMADLDAVSNAGVWTWTLRNGRWSFVVKADFATPPGYPGNYCWGWYDVDGAAVHFTTVQRYPSGECAPAIWSARWMTDPVGLKVTYRTDDGVDFLFSGKLWRRIG
jgi:TRAP-type C4-dicarboxylate transport system substrate-binding protein